MVTKATFMTHSNAKKERLMKIEQIHHVAYRCRDAKETVEWYSKMLNMDFILAIAEDHVPSTHEPDPYMHIFMDAGNGNVLAFFELPTKPEMGRDPNTPIWVQHIAFKVKDRAELLEFKEHLEAQGVDVLGVTDHSIFHSIYFFDPNGHRVELACPDPAEDALLSKLDAAIFFHSAWPSVVGGKRQPPRAKLLILCL
jgi:catechol 2,3-dioxygenase-like lactoylglutathione lyase family enzyme